MEQAEGPLSGLEAGRTGMTDLVALSDREAEGTPAPLAAGIGTCDEAEGLAAIKMPGMELVIWQRALPLCLQTWLEDMDASRLPGLRLLVRPGSFRHAVEPHLDDCGMPPGDMRDLLVADVEELVLAFSRITGSDLVDVRLARISHRNRCIGLWNLRKFFCDKELIRSRRKADAGRVYFRST